MTRAGGARDALAGFQLAAMNIPQALGYTKIAGMPVVAGFYTLLLPLLAFAAFGSSRYLVGRRRFGNRVHSCWKACDNGSPRKREICGAGIDGCSAYWRISAAGPHPQARLLG